MTDPQPLSQRVLVMADWLEELNAHYDYQPDAYWRPSELRTEAKHMATEEREAVDRELMVLEVAVALYGDTGSIADAHERVRNWYINRAAGPTNPAGGR